MVWQWLTLTEAADRLGVSRRGVQKLIDREVLPAERAGNRWLVSVEDISWYERVRLGRGRPMTVATAWEVLFDAGFARNLTEPRHADLVRRKLRARADHRHAFIHPRLAGRVLERSDVAVGGRHAADAVGIPAGAGEHWDLYLSPTSLSDLERQRLIVCQPSAVDANTVVHVVDPTLGVLNGVETVPASVAWCDLGDAGDRAADLVADRLLRSVA
jgi:excisionase family DNA binding protein